MFERQLSRGGGMLGGCMMFNEIVARSTPRPLASLGCLPPVEPGSTPRSVLCASTLCSVATKAGWTIFNS